MQSYLDQSNYWARCPQEVKERIVEELIEACLLDFMAHIESPSKLPNPYQRCLDFAVQTSYSFCVDLGIRGLEKALAKLSRNKELVIEEYKSAIVEESTEAG